MGDFPLKDVAKRHWAMVEAHKMGLVRGDRIWEAINGEGFAVPHHLEWGFYRYLKDEGLEPDEVDPIDFDLYYVVYEAEIGGEWRKFRVEHDPWGVKVFEEMEFFGEDKWVLERTYGLEDWK